jgi:hypothetical protein
VIKIRSTTYFGGEVKPSVPCRRFTLNNVKEPYGHRNVRKQNLPAISHPKSPDRLLEGSSGPIRMNRIIHGGRQRETIAGKFSHDNLWLRASRVTTLRNEYKRLGIPSLLPAYRIQLATRMPYLCRALRICFIQRLGLNYTASQKKKLRG